MDATTLIRLGAKHAASVLPESLYLATGFDLTKPTTIRGVLNDRCNYKCLHCGCWRLDKFDEMGIDLWIAAMASLKEFLGRFVVQFIGGEPFVKRGFLDLLESCRSREIDFGLITNGSAFVRSETVRRLVATRPMNVDISVDGPTAEIHDHIRGVPGSLADIERGIGALVEERGRAGVSFPIRIKPTINALNFRAMPDLVRWTTAIGASSVDINVLGGWTEEARTLLWPTPDEVTELRGVVDELLRMKRAGAPIETSEHHLLGMPDHFLRNPVAPEVGTCRIGLRVYTILPTGLVESCAHFPPIGDAKTQSAREIWTSALTREARKRTVECQRGCFYGCMATKPFKEKVRRGLMLLAGPS
ncbi:radical SAM protein [Isosphaeraceae bacterium EP7]